MISALSLIYVIDMFDPYMHVLYYVLYVVVYVCYQYKRNRKFKGLMFVFLLMFIPSFVMIFNSYNKNHNGELLIEEKYSNVITATYKTLPVPLILLTVATPYVYALNNVIKYDYQGTKPIQEPLLNNLESIQLVSIVTFLFLICFKKDLNVRIFT